MSLGSIRSSGVEKTFRKEKKGDGELHSFDKILIMACEKFDCPYTVSVRKEVKPDYLMNFKQANTKLKTKRIKVLSETLSASDESAIKTKRKSYHQSSLKNASISFHPLPIITVTMVYDNYNTLREILITKMKDVPRSLLRIFHLLLPCYRNLVRITISKCKINMYTIYKLGKILETSTITEVCLDDSPVIGADYTMLLETTKLRYLSLCRCNIEDDACKSIAAKLRNSASAQNLLLLNLSSNRITDEGAKHISNALRSNRHLRYLNLADNHITDCGVGQILDVLIEFPLTSDEIIIMRRRRLEYLKRRNDMYAKCLGQLCHKSLNGVSQLRKKSPRRKTSVTSLKNKSSVRKEKDMPTSSNADDDYIKTKAEMLTTEILGPFEDPFHSETIKHIEGYVYSIGNMTLSYLNLAYNNLSYLSVRKLQNVIKYQINFKINGGLIKIVIEGNKLPISCPELTTVDEMMARNTVGKKTSRAVKQ
ncbi:leucine-rich repeat-containing protein 71-like [Maniola hyperantus]|uniref:leucine-rich repeat-containing protein 71-like n=1 Tax=Aphantopus hyperantus TaxID=2795564 RepID=UPI0015698805|nr:uncharacterized protein LOC117992353 [Maniola hyperantus]